ncbi:MAG: hypothetical protein LBE12_01050, partial [Planctomycetaceae bacterium]|nr:hypothetical protein [Planctomycetaceae bacterium]
MLRRSSILSISFLLVLALFAPTVKSQTTSTYHIGISQTLENGQLNPNYQNNGTKIGDNYYFDSLQSLREFQAAYNSIQQNNDSVILILYSDQEIPNPSDVGDFYSIWSSLLVKNVTIRSGDGTLKKISTPEGDPVNADFLRIDSNNGNQKVNLIIDKNISIRAGSATEPNRYATSIFGGDFTAEGVTYQGGGSIFVTNAENLRSAVHLNGASFVENVANLPSNNAILSLNNITSVDLRNTNFIDNNAEWLVYVSKDLSDSSNVRIELGATEGETESVLGSTTDNRGGIFLGGTGSGSYTVNISGNGDFRQNQKIETNNGNYSLTINKTGLGTWFVAEEITNQFNVQGSATMNISAGILEMGGNSKIELHSGNNASLNLSGNSSLNMGDAAIFEVHGTTANLTLNNNSTLN